MQAYTMAWRGDARAGLWLLWLLWLLAVAARAHGGLLEEDGKGWLAGELLEKEVSGWFGGNEMMPVNLEGREERLLVLVARVQMGGQRSVLRLVLDFDGDDVVLASSDWAQRSSTLRVVADQATEIMYINGEDVEVPVRFDPAAAAKKWCPSCHGVLGMGRGSLLWLRWRNMTVTNGNLWLGGRADWEDWPRVSCGAPPQREMCRWSGVTVHLDEAGDSGPFDVKLDSGVPKTYLPRDLYDRWAGGRSLATSPNAQDWPDLHLQVPVLGGGGGETVTITLPSNQLVVGGSGNPMEIMVEPWSSDDTIFLGDGAWQQFSLHLDGRSGLAGLQRWHSKQKISTLGKVMVVVLVLIVLVWKLTPTPFTVYQHAFGLWPSYKNRSAGHAAGSATDANPMGSLVAETAAGRVIELDKGFQKELRRELQPNYFDYREYEGYAWTALELFTLLAVAIVWFSTDTRIALRGEPMLDVVGATFLLLNAFGVLIGLWGFWSSSHVVRNGVEKAVISARLFVGQWSRRTRREDTAEMVRMAHARVAVMRTACNEMLAGMAVLFILVENRSDTLATFFGGFCAYLLMLQVVYHLTLHIYLMLEGVFSFTWMAWCCAWCFVSVVLWWILSEALVVHLVRRHIFATGRVAWATALAMSLTSVVLGLVVVPPTHRFLLTYVYEGRFLRANAASRFRD